MKEEKIPTVELSWAKVVVAALRVAGEIKDDPIIGHNPVIYGVPRGGIPCATLVYAVLASWSGSPSLTEEPNGADVFIDDIIDSGNTCLRYERLYGTKPFFALFKKPQEELRYYSFPWERMVDEPGPEENVRRILQFIGEDDEREGLKKTPQRVVRSWARLFGGYNQDPKNLFKAFGKDGCDEMVVLRDIEFYSTCEHHMLPFFGRAHIGYLPGDKLIGISKLARLLEVFSRRLQIQERIGHQVTEALMEIVKPAGCGCLLEAQHFCMTSRGVEKQNSVMVTSSLAGSFHAAEVKAEFLRLIGK